MEITIESVEGDAYQNFIDSIRDKETFRNMSREKINEFDIKTDKELIQRKEDFPEITLADILDSLFDVTPMTGNKIFSQYNNVLIDIRNAKKQNLDYIELEKTELESFKKLFEKGLDGKPEFNRKIAFVSEILDQAWANIIQEKTQN